MGTKMGFFGRCCVLILIFAVLGVFGQKSCKLQKPITPCRCLMKGEEFQIWCTHSDLQSVLEGLKSAAESIPNAVDELILENNFLPSLPGKAFFPLKVLRLMLRHNGLERVSASWLSGLETDLVELYVVEPELRSFPDDSLLQMISLQAVTIQSNLLKRLPLFSGLPKLRYLQIESHSLVELSPNNFKNNPLLEKLHISSSPRLTRLEANVLRDLPSLTFVNISYCGIDWMHPRAIWRLPVLKELVLVGNRFVDAGMVGRGSRELPQLEVLRLDRNYIDQISEAAFVDLPSLKKLYLSENRITDLHYGAFHRVPLLRSLDLNRNNLRRVHPESFLQQSASGLEEIFLIENDIGHVADLRSLLDALPRLIYLDMSYNNLEAIPYGSLRGHPTLEHLNLNYNKIHLIDREALIAMPALRELRLRNNSLTDSLEPPLWNLPELKGLDLSGNFFRRLDQSLLANLPSLRKIDLSSNQLSVVDPNTFLPTPLLENINISNNDLTAFHPATFRHLLNLYELDASHNHLIEFVPGLPRGIEYLHIRNNVLTALPYGPSPDLDLPVLRMLDISENKISKTSENSFRTLPQLRRLYFYSNLLKKIEEGSFRGLNRLELLDLHDNAISQIHPQGFKEMMDLRDLNLRGNRMDILVSNLFRHNLRLKKLDVSRNRLAEILPETLAHNKELQMIDASYNVLVKLPTTINGLQDLRALDLTDNRLKSIDPEILGSLSSLKELKLSKNYIQELKQNAFINLQHLRRLYLDNNELEVIEPNSIRNLPVLKSIRLSQNKIKEIPNFALNNLPSLQIAELQENQIKVIAPEAFNSVPYLLMLNLSHNYLTSLEDAGLKSLRSLEMLDFSFNHLSRVISPNLEQMEWMVELRMDNNRICGVQGSPFNGMPRLRVLSMRNNRMMSFPEHALDRVRSNIAILDIDGNPLACACNMLWLQTWLQERSLVGPRCVDGVPLREIRLSREECPEEERNVELVAQGCEAELLSAPGMYGTSQISTPWMSLKAQNTSKQHKNNLAPLPEDSEYFYDEYVDYPYNDTNIIEQINRETSTVRVPLVTTKSPHFISGDTPTIYAAPKNKTKTKPDIPKEVNDSPSSSGFTFFGVPLNNINLNNILGAGIGRTNDKRQSSTVGVGNTENVSPENVSMTDRVAIMAKQGTKSNGPGVYGPPNQPKVENGGFIPMLPGSGGFKPIPNPNLNNIEKPNQTVQHKSDVLHINKTSESSNEASNVSPTKISKNVTSVTAIKKNLTKTVQFFSQQLVNESTVNNGSTREKIQPTQLTVTTQRTDTASTLKTVLQVIENNSEVLNNHTSTNDRFNENVIRETTEKSTSSKNGGISTNIQTNTKQPLYTEETTTTATKSTSLSDFIITTENVDMSALEAPQSNTKGDKIKATPLSALLVPGGQQPPIALPKAATITKIHSPYASATAPLRAGIETGRYSDPFPTNREAKNSHDYVLVASVTSESPDVNDKSWYFETYNDTNLRPYVGKPLDSGIGGSIRPKNVVIFVTSIYWLLQNVFRI